MRRPFIVQRQAGTQGGTTQAILLEFILSSVYPGGALHYCYKRAHRVTYQIMTKGAKTLPSESYAEVGGEVMRLWVMRGGERLFRSAACPKKHERCPAR